MAAFVQGSKDWLQYQVDADNAEGTEDMEEALQFVR